MWDLESGRCLAECSFSGEVLELASGEVLELAFDPKTQFLKVVLAEALLVWDWERLSHPLSVGLTNLHSVWIDPADNRRFIAVGVDQENYRPAFHQLRLENFPSPR